MKKLFWHVWDINPMKDDAEIGKDCIRVRSQAVFDIVNLLFAIKPAVFE